MTDVFLSYTSKDRPLAQKIEAAFSKVGVSAFWDQEVPAGRDWDEWIRAKLNEARVVVVLWSKASVASPNVRHEAMIARDAKKLVPLLIEDLKADDFPMGLYLVQALKLDGWSGDTSDPRWKRLEADVLARLGKTAKTAPPGSKLAQAEAKAEAEIKNGRTRMLVTLGVAPVAAAIMFFALNQNRQTVIAPETPVAEAPARQPSSIDAALGRWDWGRGCADPSVVTRDGDARLVFTTSASRFVHELAADPGAAEFRTVVIEPADFAGDVYRFAADAGSLTVEQIAPEKETNTWSRCP